jgi:mannosyl-3-phosphoglycerate phosphatase
LNSDIKIVIPGIDGPNLRLIDQLKDLEFTIASEPNGYGWKNEINKLINKLKLI